MHRVWEKERLSYFTIWIGHKFQQGLTILIANLAINFLTRINSAQDFCIDTIFGPTNWDK